jgi:hypothetical protein
VKDVKKVAGSCAGWVKAGYCAATSQYSTYMSNNCGKSCQANEPWGNAPANCGKWAKEGYCSGSYAGYMKSNCVLACSC